MRRIAALLTLIALAPACLNTDSGTPKISAGSLRFSSTAYSIGESGGSVTITVRRTGGSFGVASVLYSVADGTATAGQDYTLPPSTGMLIWSDGDAADKTFDVTILPDAAAEDNETIHLSLAAPADGETGPKNVIVDVLDDGLKEGNETILLSLTNATGGALIGAPLDATVTLLDDE